MEKFLSNAWAWRKEEVAEDWDRGANHSNQ